MQKATIVTAYFNLTKSKASHDQYMDWMTNMLCIQNRMIIFCDENSIELIQSKRPSTCETIIIATKFEDFFCWKYIDIFKDQWNTDHENSYHTIELYLIWNEKSHFLKRAIETDTAKGNLYNKYIWCDIGCFRRPNTEFIYWPDASKIPDNNTMLLLEVDPIYIINPHELPDFRKINYIGGTIFGGNCNAIQKWHKAYYEMIDTFILDGRFIGKDQSMMSAIALKYPELCTLVTHPHGYMYYYDRWFYLQHYLQAKNILE